MNRRNDYKMALLVESVIHDAAYTPVARARQLAELGVPLEVAMRVITRPSERRHHVVDMTDALLAPADELRR